MLPWQRWQYAGEKRLPERRVRQRLLGRTEGSGRDPSGVIVVVVIAAERQDRDAGGQQPPDREAPGPMLEHGPLANTAGGRPPCVKFSHPRAPRGYCTFSTPPIILPIAQPYLRSPAVLGVKVTVTAVLSGSFVLTP